MLKNTGAVLLTGLTISWVWRGIRTRALQSGNSPGPVPFEHVISDAHAPVNQWAAGVGDINGDGLWMLLVPGVHREAEDSTGMSTLPGPSMSSMPPEGSPMTCSLSMAMAMETWTSLCQKTEAKR